VAALWIVGAVACYFEYSTDLVWFTLVLGIGIALAEWRAIKIKEAPSGKGSTVGLIKEVILLSEPQRLANTRQHMSWSHRFALFWLALSLAIFGSAYAFAEIGEMPEPSRTHMLIMLGTIIVTSAIWQAAGLALARIENLILPRRKPS
jgi:hypothetical protein